MNFYPDRLPNSLLISVIQLRAFLRLRGLFTDLDIASEVTSATTDKQGHSQVSLCLVQGHRLLRKIKHQRIVLVTRPDIEQLDPFMLTQLPCMPSKPNRLTI